MQEASLAPFAFQLRPRRAQIHRRPAMLNVQFLNRLMRRPMAHLIDDCRWQSHSGPAKPSAPCPVSTGNRYCEAFAQSWLLCLLGSQWIEMTFHC
jgi:hypothetical protein